MPLQSGPHEGGELGTGNQARGLEESAQLTQNINIPVNSLRKRAGSTGKQTVQGKRRAFAARLVHQYEARNRQSHTDHHCQCDGQVSPPEAG